jgi:hypothetical protein
MDNHARDHIISFMETDARDLERIMVAFLDGRASRENVKAALLPYQHTNGGFGRGLEPDCLNPDPQPLQTWAATHYVRLLDLPATDPVVSGMLDYLEAARSDDGLYDAIIPSNNLHPHAPWWHDNVTNRRWGYNPSAALFGFIHTYRPSPENNRMINDAIVRFMTMEDHEMHELFCFVELHDDIRDDPSLFPDFDKFEQRLSKALQDIAGTSGETGSDTYGPKASTYCTRPGMFGCQVLKAPLVKEVRAMEAWFGAGNVPTINWSWGTDEDAFKTSAKAWQGILMMNAYVMLDRIKASLDQTP